MKDVAISSIVNVEVEQQLLGALLTNNDLFHKIDGKVNAAMFHDPVHRRIFEHIRQRIEKDHIASPVTLKTDMAEDTGLSQLGGPVYLVNLAGAAISSFAIDDYARELLALYDRRVMSERLGEISAEIQAGKSAGEAISELELLIHDSGDRSDQPRTMSMLRAQTIAVKSRFEVVEGRQVAVPTGLQSLDEELALMPKRYTVLAGSTSMGKTALGVWISYAAAKAGFGVGFVTLEMPEEDLANRMNSIESKIPYKAYDRPMSESLFQKTIEAAEALHDLPIEIFSPRTRDVPAILSEGKRLKNKMIPLDPFRGFKLLVVDYIQLVRGKGENSFVRLSQVANDFKQVAKMLDVHVLVLAQVDRKLGDRENPRPRLSDLRGSGDLENAPDNVVFCYRPEYYFQRQTPPAKADERADWEAEAARWKGKMEIIVSKARMGDIASVTVECDMATNTFRDIGRTEEMEF